ncbi:MAG: NADH-quinone oxidoreductase subunit A, partial [Bacteroidota bacterium]
FFVAGTLALIGGGALTSIWLRTHRPNAIKLSTYESGEASVGDAWNKFNVRFYILAIIFVLFEVETILLLPWATIWANPMLNSLTGGLWVYYTLSSAVAFIALLVVGLGYVWRQGCFASIPLPPTPDIESTVPFSYYEQVNLRYASNNAQNQSLTRPNAH